MNEWLGNTAQQILWDSIKAVITEILTCGVYVRKKRMLVICAASEGHVCVCGSTTTRGHVNVHGHVDFHGLCCCLKPYRHPVARLQPGIILVFMAHMAQEAMLMSLYRKSNWISINIPWVNKSYRIIRLYKVHTQKLLIFLYTNNYQVAFEFKVHYHTSMPSIKYLTVNIGRYTKELYEDNHKTDKKYMKELNKCWNCLCSWIGRQ